MGTRLANAPVYFTVAQIQFNPVLSMESYLPDIQSRFRHEGFPDYRREDLQRLLLPLGVTADPGDSRSPVFQTDAHFVLGDIDRTTEFILQKSSLALQTTAYETFEVFSHLLLKGLTIVHEILQLAFTERVGIRYLDAVVPKVDETLATYLHPEVLGLSEHYSSQLLSGYSRSIVSTKSGLLVSQVIVRDGHIGVPSEMSAIVPPIAARFTGSDGRHAIIDTDSYREMRELFDLARTEETLDALHREASDCFRALVTESAIAAWS